MTNPYDGYHDHPVRAVFGPLIWWRSYTRLLYLLLTFPVGLIYFVVYVTGASLGVGLLILWVGAVILALLMLALRPIAQLERGMAIGLIGERIPPIPAPRTSGPGFWKWFAGVAKDPVTWKTFAFVLLRFPLGLVCWTLVVVLVSLVLGLISAPLAAPLGGTIDFGVWQPTTPAELWTVAAIGLAFYLPMIHIVNGLAVAWGKLTRLAVTRGTSGAPPDSTAAEVPPAPDRPSATEPPFVTGSSSDPGSLSPSTPRLAPQLG
jgi:hypothetical protein